MGNVSSEICLPTGWRRPPLLSRKPPVASGPTCSRGAVCELKSAPNENRTITSAMRLRMDLAEGFICFNIVSRCFVGQPILEFLHFERVRANCGAGAFACQ